MKNIKVIFVPGNGGDGNTSYGWFPYIKSELERLGVLVIDPIYPDGVLARRDYWLPFIEKLGTDENTILIGHSSGAIASMKYAETHNILGSVLVSSYHSDLGLASERRSNYFNEPFNWEAIRNNQKWIIQFNGTDDPYIPISEAHYVQDKLGTDYHELEEGHFQQAVFPQLIGAIKQHL